MPDIIDTVQLQEIDDALIELFDITLPNGSTKIYITNGLDNGSDNIYFPETTGGYALKEYIAMPIQIQGIAAASSGAAARPTITTVNIPFLTRTYSNNGDGTNDETTLLDILEENGIKSNRDLLNSRVVYRRTLFKHTFKAGDTTSAPVEFPSTTFILDRVASEDNLLVAFEVASPIDIEGVKIPNRMVIGRYCPWKYQGVALDGDGGCIWPKNSNGRFYDKNDNSISGFTTYSASTSYSAGDKVKVTTDGHQQIWQARRANSGKYPITNPYYWFRLDVCGKLISSCKVRFQNGDQGVALPFGGFPGSRTFK